MNRKLTIILLVAITVVGSLFVMLTNNMFFSDIANIAVLGKNSTVLVTVAANCLAGIFVTYFFFVIRLYRYPKCTKRICRLYTTITCVFAFIGLITTILSATVIYKNFLSPYPFDGFCVVFLVVYILLLGGGIAGLFMINKLPEDEEKRKITVKYVFETIGWFLFMSLMFNRFGNFLVAPVYIYWRVFFMTFPFYLYLLVPVYLGVIVVLDRVGLLTKEQKRLHSIIALAVNVVLFTAIVIISVNNTIAISAVSQTMPLERLASKPIEIIIHVLAYTAVGLILLIPTIKKEKVSE